MLFLLFLSFIISSNSLLLDDLTTQQQQSNERKLLRVTDKNDENILKSKVSQILTNNVGSYCNYGCTCYEKTGYDPRTGPSIYSSSYLYGCNEASQCTGSNDINCCKCAYTYYPPNVGIATGYEYLSCCGPPPPPPTPAPTYDCTCGCNSGYGNCVIVGGGNGQCSSMLPCCHCNVPGSSLTNILGCCTPSPTHLPTLKPTTSSPTPPTPSPTTKSPNTKSPTPPTTKRPTLVPTAGSTVPCNCKCLIGYFDFVPLDFNSQGYHMCCNQQDAFSFQCYQCCLSESPTTLPTVKPTKLPTTRPTTTSPTTRPTTKSPTRRPILSG
jgi:hypothetical protein